MSFQKDIGCYYKIIIFSLLFSIFICFIMSGVQSTFVNAAIIEQDKAMGDGWQEEELETYGEVANPEAPSGTLAKGVDLSHHNETVDFSKLKDAVDFVVLRCGYGQDLTSQDDTRFEEYVKGCVEYNIPFGVYLYSYADDTTKAGGEAAHAIRLLNKLSGWGASLSLPVFYDLEDKSAVSLSAADKAQIAKTFCDALNDAGYKTGIYANTDWWNNYLTNSYFDSVIKWVAQFNDTFTYQGSAAIWQCSETASVEGISGNADLDYMLTDITFAKIFTKDTTGTSDSDSVSKIANVISASNVVKTSISAAQTFQLKAGCKGGAKLSYKSNNSNVKVSTSGKVTISKNYVGTASITITSAETTEYYSASKVVTVKAISGKVSISSLTNKASKKLLVKWKRNPYVTGYQIQYSRRKNFTYSKYASISSNKTVSKTLTGLKKNYKYYVRIRSYKTISGKKYYSSWSSVKTIKIKK